MAIIRVTFLFLFGASSFLFADQQRPNILFIFSDDHATAAISAYGSHLKDAAPTPNIDRLAKEGVLFENSFCTNSICGPSRASILTGKHSHINGYLDNNNSRFDGTQTVFPKLLQQAGYQTALIGKWHLSSMPTGFDYWQILPGQGSYNNPDLIQQDGNRKRYNGYVTDVITDQSLEWLKNRDSDKPFLLMSQHKAPHRNWSPAPRHYTLFDDITMPEPETLFDQYEGNRSSTLKEHEMGIADHFFWGWDMKFNGEAQFPEYFRPGLPNHEYSRFNDAQKQIWDAAYQPKNDKLIEAIRSGKLTGDEVTRWKYQRYVKDYLRCIRAVDENIGRVLKYLDESGLAENTLVIYSSDQGFYLGEHGWYDKRWMFEESLEMPFLARWPNKIPAGTRSKALIQNIDYAPTFLELAEAPIPDAIQGESLMPLLKSPEKTPESWRDSIYYSYYGERTHRVAQHDGVRTDRYKLIRFPNTNEWNLFDLQKDPQEMTSFHDAPEYQSVMNDLKGIYYKNRAKYQVYPTTIPKPRSDVENWIKQHRQAASQAQEKKIMDLLLIGADAVAELPQNEITDRSAMKIGSKGDQLQHLSWRLINGALPQDSTPNTVALVVDKQMVSNLNEDELDAGISNLLSIIKDRLPKSRLILISEKESLPDRYAINHIQAKFPVDVESLLEAIDQNR